MPATMSSMMKRGFSSRGLSLVMITASANRVAAIDHAIRSARPNDVVLIAGKGHEDYQEIKGVKLPFSDVEVATRALGSTS